MLTNWRIIFLNLESAQLTVVTVEKGVPNNNAISSALKGTITLLLNGLRIMDPNGEIIIGLRINT